MKKSNRLSGLLYRVPTIKKPDERSAFEFAVKSPMDEPARKLRSNKRYERMGAIEMLTDMASDRKSRMEAMEAIRELGRAAREHEDEISTSFIDKLGVETYSEMKKAAARPNKALLGAGVAATAGIAIAGGVAGSLCVALFSSAALGAFCALLLIHKPVVNALKMTRSAAWKILERHEQRGMEKRANE